VDVHFGYGSRSVFTGLDLIVPEGQITAVLGPSGSGKSTLLELMTGQKTASRGRVEVAGEEVGSLSRRELFRLRRRMGVLFQDGALFTDLSVFENVAFPVREHTRLPEMLVHHLALMKLETVGLRGASTLYPAQLSGGMARRVALARSIVLDPQIMFYDEPLVGLDPIAKGMILRLIVHLNRSLGITSVIVSHDVPEMLETADWCYLIAEGRVQGAGSPSSLRQVTSPWVRQFVSGSAEGPVPFHYPARDYAADLFGTGRSA
jgi:phospholipid/cholesterol/gamma-HCH transport system ATP-binding protein